MFADAGLCDMPVYALTVETKKYAKPYGLTVVAVFGGMNKHEQFKALKGECRGRIVSAAAY